MAFLTGEIEWSETVLHGSTVDPPGSEHSDSLMIRMSGGGTELHVQLPGSRPWCTTLKKSGLPLVQFPSSSLTRGCSHFPREQDFSESLSVHQ